MPMTLYRYSVALETNWIICKDGYWTLFLYRTALPVWYNSPWLVQRIDIPHGKDYTITHSNFREAEKAIMAAIEEDVKVGNSIKNKKEQKEDMQKILKSFIDDINNKIKAPR